MRYRIFLRRSSFVSGSFYSENYPPFAKTLICFFFPGRCEQLGCQPLALEVFGNYAKYSIILTPNAGRWLIHSIHVLHPLKDLLTAASLFSVYNISLAEDLVSASMFTAACFKHDTPQSRAVANFLLLKIKTMAEKKRLTTPVCSVDMKNRGSGWNGHSGRSIGL